MLLKSSSLLDVDEVRKILPPSLYEDLEVPMLPMTFALIGSMLSSLLLALLLMLQEIRRDRNSDVHAKRLRYTSGSMAGKDVPAPKLRRGHYHLFLSQ